MGLCFFLSFIISLFCIEHCFVAVMLMQPYFAIGMITQNGTAEENTEILIQTVKVLIVIIRFDSSFSVTAM